MSDLTPAPWTCGPVHKESEGKTWITFTEQVEIYPPSQKEAGLDYQPGGPVCSVSVAEFPGNAEFIALARNAYDVMMRRGWCAEPKRDGQWGVRKFNNHFYPNGPQGVVTSWPCPFTALVEADKWYAANVEKRDA